MERRITQEHMEKLFAEGSAVEGDFFDVKTIEEFYPQFGVRQEVQVKPIYAKGPDNQEITIWQRISSNITEDIDGNQIVTMANGTPIKVRMPRSLNGK